MFLVRRGGLVAATLISVLALVPAVASAAWRAVATPLDRNDAVAARLADGSALVAGGQTAAHVAQSSAERFDPESNAWTALAPMHQARWRAVAAALADGRVLVAGGGAGAEVYSPATDTWTDTGAMVAPRSLAAAAVLADGRVLVTGGSGNSAAHGAEIYDPATNAWNVTGPMSHTGRDSPAIARLTDGRVLVVGGYASGSEASAEIYDPATNAWTNAAPAGEPRYESTAALLADGRVLVAGGDGFQSGYPTASNTAEIYDSATDAWTPTGSLHVPRGEGAAMVTLADGRPMVIGGFWWTDVTPGPPPHWSSDSYENTAETYDAASGTWTSTPQLRQGRAGHIAVTLGNGDVLVAGGWGSNGGLTERFGPGADDPAPPGGVTPPDPLALAPVSPPPATPLPRPRAAAPGFAAARTLRVTRTGTLRVKLTCSAGAGTCHDELRLTTRAKRPRTLSRATFAARAGKAVTVTIKLSRSTRRALAGRTTAGRLTLVRARRTIDVRVRG